MGTAAIRLPQVDENEPIADGFAFCELDGLDAAACNRLGATGKVFVTEFLGVCRNTVSKFGGHLIANSWEEAEEEAARRMLGEKVVGIFHSVV